MMRLLFCAVVLFGLAGTAVSAPQRRFPYQAVVAAEDVYARSGPGRNYYPTNKLHSGRKVTVHRHDPGGWYMIAPPPGSFSWIRAEYVQNEGNGRGVLQENNVIVRVGSEFGDSRDIEQVRLSTGDTVEILGEQTFQTGSGAVRMYKIRPPRGEYRWVRGRYLEALDREARRANDRDPYTIPSHAQRGKTERKRIGDPVGSGGPRLTPHDGSATTIETPDTGSFNNERTRLAALDRRFREMVDKDPSGWDFTELEMEYRQLRAEVKHPLTARKIDRRLPTIAHYRSVQAEYAKMIQLTSETHRRDAELAGNSPTRYFSSDGSADSSDGQPTIGPKLVPGNSGGPPPATLPTPHIPNNGVTHHSPPVPNGSNPTSRPSEYSPSQGNGGRNRRENQFDGAGIIKKVRRVRPGLPTYALVTPDGRFLAYLHPVRGLPLERYVGRAMGVYGRRRYRRDLGGDFIVVRAMQPVRLLP